MTGATPQGNIPIRPHAVTTAARIRQPKNCAPARHARHPRDMGAAEIEAFLSHLAGQRNVSAKMSRRLPVVLTEREVRELLLQLNGTTSLVASLLYGTGMRLLEGLRLRIKDVEFTRREILIHASKGNKDRVTVLPDALAQKYPRGVLSPFDKL